MLEASRCFREAVSFYGKVRSTPVWRGPYRPLWIGKVISCYCALGEYENALKTFQQNLALGIEPNGQAFLGALSACEVITFISFLGLIWRIIILFSFLTWLHFSRLYLLEISPAFGLYPWLNPLYSPLFPLFSLLAIGPQL